MEAVPALTAKPVAPKETPPVTKAKPTNAAPVSTFHQLLPPMTGAIIKSLLPKGSNISSNSKSVPA